MPNEPEGSSPSEAPTRRHRRVWVDVPVRISTIDAERDPRTGRRYFQSSSELCANLSPGGAYIRTPHAMARGRRVLVEFHLPDGRPVEAVGRVAWSRRTVTPEGREDTGIGLEFVSGSPGHLTALESFLEHRRKSDTGSDGV